MSAAPASARHVIVGAGGFIGLHLVRGLVARGLDVVAIDQSAMRLAHVPVPTRIEAVIDDSVAMAGMLRAGDTVHLLAGGALPDDGGAPARRQLDATVGATLDFVDMCTKAGVRRLMFPSSGGTVYGVPRSTPIREDHPTDPISSYGVQKLAVEKYLAIHRRLKHLDSVVMRIGNPFGPGQDPTRGQGLIGALSLKAVRGEAIEIWGDGEVVRDYLYIDDLIEAMIALSLYEGDERVFNVGSGEGLSVNQVLAAVARAAPDLALNVVRKPARAFDVLVNVLDIASLRRETGWAGRTPFEDGVARTVSWFRGDRGLPRR
jgi:UDP-glucose 4-epimerase